MEYSLLNALNDTHDNWRIRVRICRLWESTNPHKDDELISIDMILIDDKENLMHATIRKHLASRFKHLLQEGSLYSIRNLRIVRATGSYRPISGEYKALFLATTSSQRLEEDNTEIPLHGFQFVLPNVIESRLNDKTVLSDVVGYLSGIGGIEIVGNNWKKRDLEIITNHSVTATITLWGNLSEQFNPNLYKEDGAPYIIIVTSTTIKKFKGALCFSSTNNSKIYMNLDTPYVMSLRERFAQHFKKLQVTETSNTKKLTLEEKMFYHRMTIKELVDAKWNEDLEEYIATVRGKISGIDNKFGWYYVSCKSCEKKIVSEEGVYTCNHCKITIDYPLTMFMVHVYVEDHTGTTTLTLFNNLVERLLDTSAKKLVNRLPPGDNDFPREFQTLLGKEFIYKLRLNHYNFKEGFANYSVSEVYKPDEKLERKYESKISQQMRDNLQDDLEHDHEKNPFQDKKKKKSVVVDDEDNNEEDNGGNNFEADRVRAALPDNKMKKRKMIMITDEDDNEVGHTNN